MKKIQGLIIGIAVICFAAITSCVVYFGTPEIDTLVTNWFYQLRVPGLNTLMELITYAGNWESITILCLLLLIFEKTRVPYGIPVAATAIGTTVIKSIVKPIVARPRPDVAMQLISEGGYSFPSGHAITSIAVYGLLIFLVHQYMEDRKKAMGLTIVLGILAVGIGLSRIYLGVHYLTDVVGGWSAGIAVMVTVMMINQHISAKKQQI